MCARNTNFCSYSSRKKIRCHVGTKCSFLLFFRRNTLIRELYTIICLDDAPKCGNQSQMQEPTSLASLLQVGTNTLWQTSHPTQPKRYFLPNQRPFATPQAAHVQRHRRRTDSLRTRQHQRSENVDLLHLYRNPHRPKTHGHIERSTYCWQSRKEAICVFLQSDAYSFGRRLKFGIFFRTGTGFEGRPIRRTWSHHR